MISPWTMPSMASSALQIFAHALTRVSVPNDMLSRAQPLIQGSGRQSSVFPLPAPTSRQMCSSFAPASTALGQELLSRPNSSTAESAGGTGNKPTHNTSSYQGILDDFDHLPRTAADLRKTGRGPATATRAELQSAVTACARTGLERLQRCWEYLQRLQASSGGSSAPAAPAFSVPSQLLEQCRQDDYWLLVQCGEWLPGQGPKGPALALLQVWYDSAHSYADYMVWELGPDGWPNGECISSATAFENMTTKASSKRFRSTIKVLLAAMMGDTWQGKEVSLATWLRYTFGDDTIRAKSLGADTFTWKYHPKKAQQESSSSSSGRVQRLNSRSARRLDSYVGQGCLPPGPHAAAALQVADTAAAAAAAAGQVPCMYVWPQEAPAVRSGLLQPPHMSAIRVNMRHNLLQDIASGAMDLAQTHVPLSALLAHTHASNSSSNEHISTTGGGSSSSDSLPAGRQVYDLHELQQRAGKTHPDVSPVQAVVPDSTQPFTITMRNTADGQDYVVAHYEPHALTWRSAQKAALLCEVYHSNVQITRSSAPRVETMAMAGMRLPRGSSGQLGRYVGDEGPEPDQFSLSCWPELATVGGFRVISSFWTDTLPGLVCARNHDATVELTGGRRGAYASTSGPPANYPVSSLFGSPFTTLAVTQNYLSHLHCEPEEHPFSFITWLDVLGAGSSMKVGHFWLTNGLAFAPRHGSALYIDVRLVTHCSDPCKVENASLNLEGRYGAALFIKPAVYQTNAMAWALFDAYQNMQRPSSGRQQLVDNTRAEADTDNHKLEEPEHTVGAGLDRQESSGSTADSSTAAAPVDDGSETTSLRIPL